ncbi:GFA family protein [Sphingomonas sp. LaA6.9]|uniref:GFA family protein n=1 Tax=Sphingomonas sp. LaA6.9 TaxID=2919914 RepID=UPI001F4F45ED|nr:GFA family protein [Sphingomonas sp. LaA6.9]MCJ8159733.1 GFA family protein [Sphingomonas sp. LaA6.9]
MLEGGCHCGAVRYQVSGTPAHNALCHCTDCRRSAGAPLVGWALFAADDITVRRGEPRIYASSENGRRHFCPACGTGLFYTNETIFPGMIDIQSATLDDPDALGPPSAQIQVAERIGWMADAHALPAFERYPEF